MPNDQTPTRRIIRLLLLLLQSPYRYTRLELEGVLDVTEPTIRRYFAELRANRIELDRDRQNRYAIIPQRSVPELRGFAPVTAQERDLLRGALASASAKTRDAATLLRKLDRLVDVQRLGLRALRTPELAKVEILERAKEERECVRLHSYRSTNAGETSDRLVEAFALDTVNGIVHAYDLARGGIRHFRLDRFERVTPAGEPWTHEAAHVVEATDVFRIVDREQVRVELELGVRAYNDLTERFPAAKVETSSAAEDDRYHFEARVNHRFLGLLPFVLGNYRDVEVIGPEGLRVVVQEAATELLRKVSPDEQPPL